MWLEIWGVGCKEDGIESLDREDNCLSGKEAWWKSFIT